MKKEFKEIIEESKKSLEKIEKNMEARSEDFTEEVSELWVDLKKHLSYAYSARFIHAYKDVASHEDYDHVRMMKKLNSNHGVSILTSSNPKNYGAMLTKIYNFKFKCFTWIQC